MRAWNKRCEQDLIQKRVPRSVVEALDESVLYVFSHIDVVPVHAGHYRPGEDRITRELSAVAH